LRTLYLYRILLPQGLFIAERRESFTMVVEANNYIKQFPKYQ